MIYVHVIGLRSEICLCGFHGLCSTWNQVLQWPRAEEL